MQFKQNQKLEYKKINSYLDRDLYNKSTGHGHIDMHYLHWEKNGVNFIFIIYGP